MSKEEEVSRRGLVERVVAWIEVSRYAIFVPPILALLIAFCCWAPGCVERHERQVQERTHRSWVEQWRSCDQTCSALDLPTMPRVWTDWGVRCRCGGAGRIVIFPPNAASEDAFEWIRKRP